MNESTNIALEFTPTQIGSFNENISIRNNSPEKQQIIKIKANVFSPNYLKLQDTDVSRSNSYNININLVNKDNIRAIQFDLNIPDGFTFYKDYVIKTSILNNFTTSISSSGNNSYRFIIYTIGNDFIVSDDETILMLPIFIENTVDLGQYTFEFSNVILSSESNENISSEALMIGYVNVIEDTTAPIITLIGENAITLEVGTSYNDAGATALDNNDGDLSANIIVTGTVDTSTVGMYTITYSATNASENTGSATITVIIVDTILPVITLLGDNPVSIKVGSTYTDAGATASDNYDGDLTSSITTVNNVNQNTVGTYTVTYNVSDANSNSAQEVTRTVNVVSNLSVEENSKSILKIYPNPTNNSWNISTSITIQSIQLYDIIGKKVLAIYPKTKDYKINGAKFSNGVYILVLNNKKVSRLIKN